MAGGSFAALPRRTGSVRGVGQSLTVMPMERAVPAMIRSAMSRSLALRSAILVWAISRSWARVTEPTLSLCGVPEPFGTPDALISRVAAGGVLSTNVNVRSSYTLIWAGTTSPRCDSVAALYALQNSMMFTPCWPSAGPTGGAGVAWPAFSCSVKVLTSFFFGGMSLPGLGCSWLLARSCYRRPVTAGRSEEHTSELQSLRHLVCRLLLEKKKKRHK